MVTMPGILRLRSVRFQAIGRTASFLATARDDSKKRKCISTSVLLVTLPGIEPGIEP